MRYIDHGKGGAPEVMRIGMGAIPTPKPGEVLIKVAYAGVNRPDCLQRSGLYPPPVDASAVMGLEVSGAVAAVGDGVAAWKTGDAVCALTPGGGYAEYCVAPAGHCLPVPSGVSLRDAALLPENIFTVWANVFMMAKLQAGESFLVHGGSSGIGYAAIQLAKAHGATVFTTAGSADKVAFCERLGADHACDYRESDWAAWLWEATQKRGVNVILDMVGGDYVAKNLRSLAVEGRLMQIAFLRGPKVEIDATQLMLKRLTWSGSTLRARSVAAKAEIAAQVREHVWPMIEAGKFQVVVHQEYPLEDAAKAHALMESNQHIGKLVLKVS